MRPDYPIPDPYLIRPLKWHWEPHEKHGQVAKLWVRSKGEWSTQLPWTGLVHEALEAECPFHELVTRLAAKHPHPKVQPQAGESMDVAQERHWRSRLGTYLFVLREEGYVGIDLPSGPPTFRDGLTFKRELGRGGIGVAWLAHDEPLGHDVVVKHAWDFFQPLATADKVMRREAEVLARLAHPNVVKLYDTFERDGLVHLVREYVDGVPLPGQNRLEGAPLRSVALQIIELVQHAHDQQMLLIDLRPTNFFLRVQDHHVTFIDVGIATDMQHSPRHEGQTRLRKSMGSPGYAAPETRKKMRASTASDAYGVGRLLFTVATGTRPLKEWTPDDLATRMEPGALRDVVVGLTQETWNERMTLQDAHRLLEAWEATDP